MTELDEQKAGIAAPPSIRDFSHGAVRKAVRKEGLTHPLTIYPLAFGLLGGLASFLFGSPVLLFFTLGSLFLGSASGVINLFFRDRTLANRYLRNLSRAQEKYETQVLRSLKEELEQCRSLSSVKKQAGHGIEQFDRAQAKFRNVHELLDSKVSAGELAYSRFITAAQQVYLSVLDNLRQAAAIMRSAGTIDLEYVSKRLEELRVSELDQAEMQEEATLKERLDILQDQVKQADRLLAANEQAMTSLEETTHRLATLDTQSRFAATDVDTAIGYLQELSRGADKLTKSPPKTKEVEA